MRAVPMPFRALTSHRGPEKLGPDQFHRIPPPTFEHFSPRIGYPPSVDCDPHYLCVSDGLERGCSHVESR